MPYAGVRDTGGFKLGQRCPSDSVRLQQILRGKPFCELTKRPTCVPILHKMLQRPSLRPEPRWGVYSVLIGTQV